MKVQIIERQPVTVAYLRHVGSYGLPISEFWEHTVCPWLAANALLGQPRYGISHDDPGVTVPDKCRYDACAEVPRGFIAMGKVLTTTIPGGKYAVAHFSGSAAQIGAAWAALLRDWLPASGMQLDARPCFEHYPPSASDDAETGIFECDIVIPVVPI